MNNKNSGPRPLTLEATSEYEIHVRPALEQWAVIVYKLPDKTVVTEDFFPNRETAVGRAHDFKTIIVKHEMPAPNRSTL